MLSTHTFAGILQCDFEDEVSTQQFMNTKIPSTLSHDPQKDVRSIALAAKPISVLVAYEWSSDELDHPIWPFIRDHVKRILDGIEGSRSVGNSRSIFKYTIGRMRAHHGADILAAILRRCQETDIIIFDISSRNPNVMVELGIALGSKGPQSGQVFVLQDEEALNTKGEPVGFPGNVPSDLRGYCITSHKVKGKKRVFVDFQGFRSSIVYIAKKLARERGIWSDPKAIVEN
jgi:hypothetical protein